MYSIKFNETIVAVSTTIEAAMRASKDLLCRYTGIQNPNCVKFPHGIQFHPECNSAICDAEVNTYRETEIIRVFITEIEVV
jgi:hypothetical protein